MVRQIVDVQWPFDVRSRLGDPVIRGVEIVDLEPCGHSDADGYLGGGQWSVLGVAVTGVQLQDDVVVDQYLLVLRAAVTTDRTQNLLVPAACGGDVGDHEHRLGSDAA